MSEKVLKKGDEGMVFRVWPIRCFLFLCVLGLVLLRPLQAFSQSGNIEEEQPSYFSHVVNVPNSTESSLRYFPVEPLQKQARAGAHSRVHPAAYEAPVVIAGRTWFSELFSYNID